MLPNRPRRLYRRQGTLYHDHETCLTNVVSRVEAEVSRGPSDFDKGGEHGIFDPFRCLVTSLYTCFLDTNFLNRRDRCKGNVYFP